MAAEYELAIHVDKVVVAHIAILMVNEATA